MSRADVVASLAEAILAVERPHPTRVAIDGPDASGKSTLADELAELVRSHGRDVIRASLDDFQRPRALRYARGPLDPRGYFEDAFDLVAVHALLLDPLGPAGDRRYRRASFDYRFDEPVSARSEAARRDAILLLDGVFLLRPELRDAFDLAVVVTAAVEERIRRARERDAVLFGSTEAVETRYRERYVPAYELYVTAAQPEVHASAIVDNDDAAEPLLRMRPPTHG